MGRGEEGRGRAADQLGEEELQGEEEHDSPPASHSEDEYISSTDEEIEEEMSSVELCQDESDEEGREETQRQQLARSNSTSGPAATPFLDSLMATVARNVRQRRM